MHVLSRLCFHQWFSFPVVDGFSLLLRILNLYSVAKNNCYAVHISSPTLVCICSGYEPRPHLFVDLYDGYNYLASTDQAYRSSKTPDEYVFSVIHTA